MCNVVGSHPSLPKIQYPINRLVALYVLSGSDYISSFFRTSKQVFINAFVDNCTYICNEGPFVELTNIDTLGMTGSVIKDVSITAWYKLVCCVYLLKHKALFHNESIRSLHKSVTVQLTTEKKRLMKVLAYKES